MRIFTPGCLLYQAIFVYTFTCIHRKTAADFGFWTTLPTGAAKPRVPLPPRQNFVRVFVANELPASHSIERIPLLSKYSAVWSELMEPATQCRLYQNQVKIVAIVAY